MYIYLDLRCFNSIDTGAVFTWGYGANGRLGHGNTEDRATPKLMDTLNGAKVYQFSTLATTNRLLNLYSI